MEEIKVNSLQAKSEQAELSNAQSDETEELTESEQNSAKLEKGIKRREKHLKHYQYFLLYLVILLVIVWVLFFKVIGLTAMPSEDMYPSIHAGDMLLFYRLDKTYKYQNVVVFEKATSESNGQKQLMVGRVIGAPGDTVSIEDGRVFVNGVALLETNIFYTTPERKGYVNYPVTLGADEYFILSDYREEGTDSRYFGPVDKDHIIGSVITVFRRMNI